VTETFFRARAAYNGHMLLRRPRPRMPSFEERLEALRAAGFQVHQEGSGRLRVSRGASAAIVEAAAGACPRIAVAGRLIEGEIARLVDAGFQKFWRNAGGRQWPALAAHLSELHALLEDVRECLGLISPYNTSLGTVNDLHVYDRSRGSPPLKNPPG